MTVFDANKINLHPLPYPERKRLIRDQPERIQELK
jgi:hypothetical protein